MSAVTELLLYGACRSQHVQQVLKPSLGRGEIILCDRFSDATTAYQGYGRGLDLDLVHQVNAVSTAGLSPDLTIILDCPVKVGLKRSWERLHKERKTRDESRFEEEDAAFHQRVREGYLEIARRDPTRVKIVDSMASQESVEKEIRKLVFSLIGRAMHG